MSNEQPPPADGSAERGPEQWQTPGYPSQPPPGQPGQPPPGQPHTGQPYGEQQGQPYPGQPSWPPPGAPGSFGPPSGMSVTAKFWLGVALSIPAVPVIGVIFGLFNQVPGLSFGARFSICAILLVVATVFGLIRERTRYVVLGVIAGIAAILVVLGGACIVLLSNLGN